MYFNIFNHRNRIVGHFFTVDDVKRFIVRQYAEDLREEPGKTKQECERKQILLNEFEEFVKNLQPGDIKDLSLVFKHEDLRVRAVNKNPMV